MRRIKKKKINKNKEYSEKLRLLEIENTEKRAILPAREKVKRVSKASISKKKLTVTQNHLRNLEKAFNYLKLESINRKKLKSFLKKYGVRPKIENSNRERQRDLYTKKYHEYLKSDEWAKIRMEMIVAFPKCQRCDSKHILQVHHKTYKNVFNEEPDDLEVLCKGCHQAEHGIRIKK